MAIPAPHAAFIDRVDRLRADARLVGVAAGGSFIRNAMDQHSDLDLLIAVEPDNYGEVLGDRPTIAASLGRILTSYTGEHLGEPRLLICLYDDPLLIVDLCFVSLEQVHRRSENPVVLWERAGRLTAAMAVGNGVFPPPDPQWIESRFWVWIYFTALRIARGELFEAINFLSFLRTQVLGPLGLERAGHRPVGLRRIEMLAPAFAEELRRTVARYDAADCVRALRATADIYRSLRAGVDVMTRRDEAEARAMAYLTTLE